MHHQSINENSVWCDDVLGFGALSNLHKDAVILILAKVVRLFSFGFLSVMLVIYLQEVGLSNERIGLMFALTLLGDMFVSLLMTSHADRWGRRISLIIGSSLSILTGITFSFQSNFWLLLISAIFGVISPSGNEIGPFMAIELSGLAQVSDSSQRTKLLAWYNLFGSFATAGGALFCGGFITYCKDIKGFSVLFVYRLVLVQYTICQILKMSLFYFLSPAIEVQRADVKKVNPVTLFLGLHKSKSVVLKLSCLFTLDSFAGAFILQSLICAWFSTTYGTKEQILGIMIFVSNIVAGVSALFAAKLAGILGMVVTMAVTHLPSNILVIMIPLMPNESWAITMVCLRFCISQMDVPVRNAYVQSVVAEDERSAANGVTNVVRSLGACLGPYLAERLYSNPSYSSWPFFVAGGLKVIYDILLLATFHSVPERETDSPSVVASVLAVTQDMETREIQPLLKK